jgi:uncharacterized membrane protein YtjA (UPF0391 family)
MTLLASEGESPLSRIKEIYRATRFVAAFLRPGQWNDLAAFDVLFPKSRSSSELSRIGPGGTIVPVTDCFSVTRKARKNGGQIMLNWVVTFLVIALIAGVLGFGGIAGASIEIAKIIFFIALILLVVSAVVGLLRGRPGA